VILLFLVVDQLWGLAGSIVPSQFVRTAEEYVMLGDLDDSDICVPALRVLIWRFVIQTLGNGEGGAKTGIVEDRFHY
jgi:hypothetical protein